MFRLCITTSMLCNQCANIEHCHSKIPSISFIPLSGVMYKIMKSTANDKQRNKTHQQQKEEAVYVVIHVA